MALSDWEEPTNKGADDVKTAQDNIAEFGEAENDVANRAAAEAAGVKDAAFIDYEVALEAYEAREDVEPLAEKNARDMPDTFADAAFMREAVGGGAGSSTP